MSHHERYPSQEAFFEEETDSLAERDRFVAGRWVLAAFLVALAVLAFRITALGDLLARTTTNPAILKAVMEASSAQPLTNLGGGEIPQILPGYGLTGMQGRALSAIAQSEGQLATAELWLIRGMADRSSLYLSQFELCRLYWNEGQRAQAREACRGTKVSVEYWLNRGYDADNRMDLNEALAYYEMAATIDPDSIASWKAMGRTLLSLNRYDEAVIAYERVMVLDQSPDSEIYEALGWAYLRLDNLTMARDVLNRGLLVFPNQRGYYLAMAATYRDEGDLDAADGWYARMLQRWPFDVQAWAGRGDLAVATGRLDDAVLFYQEAVDNQPQGFDYWINLASSAAAGGDIPRATAAYQQALTLQPDNTWILMQVGRFYVDSDQIAEAREVFEHILVLQPDNQEAIAQLAGLEGRTDR